MKALILAAGYATRLYPLTKDYPKPLLEVKEKPIINYIIDKLKSVPDLNEIYIVTNNKFINIFKKWSKTLKTSKKITLVNDLTKTNQDRLGAIGDINFVIAKHRIKEDLLVIGGDNLFSGSLKSFLDESKKKIPATSIGVYHLKNKKDASRYGVVKLDKNNKIIDFAEKPDKPKSNFVAMCLYYIPNNNLNLISEYIKNGATHRLESKVFVSAEYLSGDKPRKCKKIKTDATGNYIDWLKDKTDVYGYVFKGSWFDIGDYKYLNAAKKNFANH